MNKLFAEWYKIANPHPSSDTILAREKVCDGHATKVDTEMIVRLVSLFLEKGQKDVELASELSGLFHEGDPTFSMRDNQLELQVLSGATLSSVIEGPKAKKALIASTALDCGRFGMKRVLIEDIVDIAKLYINKEAVESRETGDHSTTSFSLFKANENFSDVNLWGPLLKEFAKTTSIAVNRLEQAMRVSAEETNILWWILNGRTKEEDAAYDGMDSTTASMLLAKDLADLTVIFPGPIAASATLAHMLGRAKGTNEKEIQLSSAINTLPESLRTKWLQQSNLAMASHLTPVALALKKSLEVDNSTGWLPVFEKASSISPRAKYTPLQISVQLYKEMLLLKYLQNNS